LDRFRSGYYRDKFRLYARWTFFLAIFNAILVAIILYLYLVQPKVPQEFYTSNLYNGNNDKIFPLDQALLKPSKLIDWAQNILNKTFTFNFVNYNEIFDDSKKYYTDKGWDSFNNALEKTRLLDVVIENKYFLSATAAGTPVILDDGVVQGHHAWHVRAPVVLVFKTSDNAAAQMQKNATLDAIIIRIPDIDNPENVAIDNLTIFLSD
jgi:intracellular multiplication protein IcmL